MSLTDFSDDETEIASDDELKVVIAEGRRENWSDDDDDDVDNLHQEEEDDTQSSMATALFGQGDDPIGKLRTKALTIKRNTIDRVDKYVQRAGTEAKRVRKSRQELLQIKVQSDNAIKKVLKNKSLTNSAKETQRTQHEKLVGPRGEIVLFEQELSDQEQWLNTILAQRNLRANEAITSQGQMSQPSSDSSNNQDWHPNSEEIKVLAQSRVTDHNITKDSFVIVPSGLSISWVNNGHTQNEKAEKHGSQFGMKKGSKFSVTNPTNRSIPFKVLTS